MSSRFRWLLLTPFALALGVSAFLYRRSQSADFDAHARAVASIGAVQSYGEQLSKQVLAARFGLLNNYDPIVVAEAGLEAGATALASELSAAVLADRELSQRLGELSQSIAAERRAVEHFKAENSILKNSLYYLPSASNDVLLRLLAGGSEGRSDQLSLLVTRLASTTLTYNLVGDESSRLAYARALSDLSARRDGAPAELASELSPLVSHARVIGEKQPAVDRWLKQVVESDLGSRLEAVDRVYQERFARAVTRSNQYRRVLYGWSLLLLLAVGAAGVQLRRLYADLEQRVAARTAELRQALSALWGEMRLARKIQEALVPTAPSLAGCDVAALMKPTEEVGGDYYDVVRTTDAEWILIGDVSGHGVPAGLIMMMCHTAVRTLLKRDPEIMPHELLARVNTVLSENIRQLGENKYMTISALRREADGSVLFAGAHQDIYIYRAGSDSVEALETRGLWLGLKDDIAHALTTSRFRLARGDVLVLYTDGVTEASQGDALFDSAGVLKVLAGAKDKTAQQILDELFAALADFKVSDDATVVVVRQLELVDRSRQSPALVLQ